MLKRTLSLVFYMGVAGVGTAAASNAEKDSQEFATISEPQRTAAIIQSIQDEILATKERLSRLELIEARQQAPLDHADKRELYLHLKSLSEGQQDMRNYLEFINMASQIVKQDREMNPAAVRKKDDKTQAFLDMMLDLGPTMKEITQKKYEITFLCMRSSRYTARTRT